jgi:4-diphosphocytidyl-2-C-methyl-D-erythritol kinase
VNTHRALAPAKVNLGLFLGPTRASDGRHELVTVMQSISLADELTLQAAPEGVEGDEVLCPGVPGPPEENLAAAALRAFRASTGWDASPLRMTIVKRIPVAGGMGGGSADAAAALRLAGCASGLGDERLLLELAAELGADVPAQVSPGRWLAEGAGEKLRALPGPAGALGLLVLPLGAELSTGAVYAEADRLGLGRTPEELERCSRALWAGLADGAQLPPEGGLVDNDLQAAALSLCPQIAEGLELARAAGASRALVSGSGPTVIGLFADRPGSPVGGDERAARAAEGIRGRAPGASAASTVEAAFAAAAPVDPGATA